MGIQGMELFAIGVVIILFVAVLKQFGILEPMSLEDGECKHLSSLVSFLFVACFLHYVIDYTSSIPPIIMSEQ